MRGLSQDMGGASSRTPTLMIHEMTQFCEQDPEVLSGKPFYANVMCDIAFVFTPKDMDRKMYYLACPKCKKKVFDNNQGYQCEACAQTYTDAVPTYNFSFKVQDCSGEVILQCLGESGEAVLGMKATDFYHISEDLEEVKTLGLGLTWKPLKVVVRAKVDQSGYSQDENGGP